MKVISSVQRSSGWTTITLLARMAARLLEAELVEPPRPVSRPSLSHRLALRAPRRRGDESCLVIAPDPKDLSALMSSGHLRSGYGQVVGLVIDSFWEDRIPMIAHRRSDFDRIFVTDADSVDPWTQITGTTVNWLPIGADILDGGSASPDRDVDVRRFGRQPSEWDDDKLSFDACASLGLRFKGRPEILAEAHVDQTNYLAELARSKFVLAFNNLEAPASYTHPTRDYLTPRWAESLGAGAVVAGRAPRCATSREFLWPGATLDLGTIERDPALPILREAVNAWNPSMAAYNNWMALQRFDWRWRISAIAEAMDISTPTLDAEMARLRAAIEDRRPAGS